MINIYIRAAEDTRLLCSRLWRCRPREVWLLLTKQLSCAVAHHHKTPSLWVSGRKGKKMVESQCNGIAKYTFQRLKCEDVSEASWTSCYFGFAKHLRRCVSDAIERRRHLKVWWHPGLPVNVDKTVSIELPHDKSEKGWEMCVQLQQSGFRFQGQWKGKSPKHTGKMEIHGNPSTGFFHLCHLSFFPLNMWDQKKLLKSWYIRHAHKHAA